MGDHAKLSASGSERWINCPGSIKLSENLPQPPDSRYALEGTKAHTLLEMWLRHAITSEFGFRIPDGYPTSMTQAVRDAVETVSEIWQKTNRAQIDLETKVSLSFIHEEMWGTLDIRIVEHFGKLFVLDYKHGAGIPVDVVDEEKKATPLNHNTQLIYYALGSAHEYNFDFDEIVLGIIQPRALHHKGPDRYAHLGVDTLRRYEDLFRKAVDEVHRPKPRFKAGKWCKFCIAQSICGEYRNAGHSDSAQAFSQFGGN